MKVNDLTVVEPGGDIVFNNLSLGQNAKSTLSKVTTVETDDSKGSEIRVNENWKNRLIGEYWQTKLRYEELHKTIIRYEAGKLTFTPKWIGILIISLSDISTSVSADSVATVAAS